jgi:hypothetical protein
VTDRRQRILRRQHEMELSPWRSKGADRELVHEHALRRWWIRRSERKGERSLRPLLL